MKPVLLLSVNFVRSQLLLLAIVLAYVICLASFLAFHEPLSELVFFIRQQAIYGIVLGAMVVVPAIHNERKSRRIMSVLSKGIHRWQYLAGLLCGAIAVAGVFCLAVEVAALWLARQVSAPITGVTQLMLLVFLACAAAASVALFCSVFLHPFLALSAAALILLFPLAAEVRGLYVPHYFSPVAATLHMVFSFSFRPPGSGLWWISIAAVIHTVIFWLAASALFARRDVTVAPE